MQILKRGGLWEVTWCKPIFAFSVILARTSVCLSGRSASRLKLDFLCWMLNTHLPPPPGWMTSNSAGKSQGWRQNCKNLSLYQVGWVTFSFDYFHFFFLFFMRDHRMKTSSSCGMVQLKLQNNSTPFLTHNTFWPFVHRNVALDHVWYSSICHI